MKFCITHLYKDTIVIVNKPPTKPIIIIAIAGIYLSTTAFLEYNFVNSWLIFIGIASP
jgi:hypothetical protein